MPDQPGDRTLLSRAAFSGEIVVVVLMVVILAMMFIPLPTFVLDLFFTINIALSFLILMLTMNVRKSLEFSVFPTVLLMTTLFRLALNVSSTRLILLHGYAGQVIEAFGNFVAGSNPVVGFIIFLILTLINFLVITKGSERVAEVAARFTLDAMPGKQMSIDADLNAGLITEEEARARRREVAREADFYGSMDGASKFVKGDAIAGLIITVINLLGGVIIGMWQRGLDALGALQLYALLTVGDGLVSQVPALLISTATGVLVTRAASEDNLGADLTSQLLRYPQILLITAVVLALFGLVPGMPTIPFLVIALLLWWLTSILRREQKERAETAVEQQQAAAQEQVAYKPEHVLSLLAVDPMEVEIGYSLIPLVDKSQGGDLFERVSLIRRQVALELGIILPAIRIRDNMQLAPNQYVIKIKGVEVGSGELMTHSFLAMDAGAVTEKVSGIPTKEPAFGLPALWITADQREKAEMSGYTVVDCPSVLATHLTEIIRNYAYELLGRQEIQAMLDYIKTDYPVVVEELIPNLMTIGEIQKVFAQLLKEGIPLRNLVTILETLADYAPMTKDTDVLTEYVRVALKRQISKMLAGNGNKIQVLTLSPQTEERILRAQDSEGEPLSPSWLNEFYASLNQQIRPIIQEGRNPVLLVAPAIRRYVRSITERVSPKIFVVSYQEIIPEMEVHSLGMVGVVNAG
ncbi:flagellar biosynthesis protein FlhA [Capillibacterium thermochitinicola]|uniref:Flagellar biosynthesis protein FlhA n=1 Tax=Capillibacterium thermochitinicola TaxID=2699427 RepID=A0A8J6LNU9_9FIRM|nr:flagellar biosynthesis protein FlhA [Capillibacterium thermochitinicola]MBA2134043.1 flagellar biosynthesis protein FlhA [Capillibacterium thermochitinicola]